MHYIITIFIDVIIIIIILISYTTEMWGIVVWTEQNMTSLSIIYKKGFPMPMWFKCTDNTPYQFIAINNDISYTYSLISQTID